MTNDFDFEPHVIDSLARLETEVSNLKADLTGPSGRIPRLERTVLKIVIYGVAIVVLILGPTAAMTLLR